MQLGKRLDLIRDAKSAQERILGAVMANWVADRA
ncbi:hypothetical protein [Tabrizicola sp.]